MDTTGEFKLTLGDRAKKVLEDIHEATGLPRNEIMEVLLLDAIEGRFLENLACYKCMARKSREECNNRRMDSKCSVINFRNNCMTSDELYRRYIEAQ